MSFLLFAMLALLVVALLFAMLRRAQDRISSGGNGTVDSTGLYSSRSDRDCDSSDGGGDGGGGGD